MLSTIIPSEELDVTRFSIVVSKLQRTAKILQQRCNITDNNIKTTLQTKSSLKTLFSSNNTVTNLHWKYFIKTHNLDFHK